jgi:thiamine-phosphate pyrophosphorylase
MQAEGTLKPRLMVLTDFASYPDSMRQLRALCRQARPGQIALVLRDRSLSLRERFDLGLELREMTASQGHALFVADRWDLMRALHADGLHLGASSLLPSRVRPYVKWVSRSVHGLADLSASELQQLDAVLLSPAFAALKGNAALGAEGLSQLVQSIRERTKESPAKESSGAMPLLFALGRVSAKTAPSALASGCDGVACIGAVLEASSRRALLSAIGIKRQLAV